MQVRSLLPVLFLSAAVGVIHAEPKTVTVKGYVIDSACAFTKNLKKPISAECAQACAKAGSPLVILADDGAIYWPISESTPAVSQNKRLIPYAGKRVTASGKVYTRGGSTALVIADIKELPDSK